MKDDLIARLEKATGPDRELDVAIYRALAYAVPSSHPSDYDNTPAYTASLDAAMTLARTPREAFEAVETALRVIGKRDDLHIRFYRGSLVDDLARQISAILIRALSTTGRRMP